MLNLQCVKAFIGAKMEQSFRLLYGYPIVGIPHDHYFGAHEAPSRFFWLFYFGAKFV